MTEETTLTAEQQRIVTDLAALQERHGWSDGQLCKHLFCGASTWNKIRNGAYWKEVKDPAPTLTKLALNLKALRRKLAGLARNLTRDWRELKEFKAVFEEVEAASAEGMSTVKRIIVFTAPTGGGKTALCAQLALRHEAVIVEARSTWRRSYWNCVRDLCEACGLDSGAMNPTVLEGELIAHLSNTGTVLAIDEAEFFGADALNLLKLIINRTPTVIVLCCMPEAYARWNRWFAHEADQVRRRTRRLLRQQCISPDDARLFLEDLGLNGCLKEASVLVTKAANTFGSIDTVKAVAAELRGASRISLDDVTKAIAYVQASNGTVPGK
jgi:DNA transposition AAA+ family ATPase